jgi:hypothetical protein
MDDDDATFADSYPPPDPRDVPALLDLAVRLNEILSEAEWVYFACERTGDVIRAAMEDAHDDADARGHSVHDDPAFLAAREHLARWDAVALQVRDLPWRLDDLMRAIAGTPRVVAWKFDCPRCNAPAGEPCRYTSGPFSASHAPNMTRSHTKHGAPWSDPTTNPRAAIGAASYTTTTPTSCGGRNDRRPRARRV